MRNPVHTPAAHLLLATLALHGSQLAGAQSPPPSSAPAGTDVFRPDADVRAAVRDALAGANYANQAVLVVFGADWCPWCRRLQALFSDDREIARRLQNDYRVVRVDVGRRDRNMDIAAEYLADLKQHGIPFLVVLAASGAVVARQQTSAFEAGEQYDRAKVAEFLTRWAPPPANAEAEFASALAAAKSSSRHVLLRFGAPWCPWCRRLDDFLSQPAIHRLLTADFVELRIDIERMAGGRALLARLRPGPDAAIPWLAVLDGDGKPIATSDGPQGNVGFPVEAHEIKHFVAMLRKGASRMTAEHWTQLERALDQAAATAKATERQRGPAR